MTTKSNTELTTESNNISYKYLPTNKPVDFRVVNPSSNILKPGKTAYFENAKPGYFYMRTTADIAENIDLIMLSEPQSICAVGSYDNSGFFVHEYNVPEENIDRISYHGDGKLYLDNKAVEPRITFAAIIKYTNTEGKEKGWFRTIVTLTKSDRSNFLNAADIFIADEAKMANRLYKLTTSLKENKQGSWYVVNFDEATKGRGVDASEFVQEFLTRNAPAAAAIENLNKDIENSRIEHDVTAEVEELDDEVPTF